MLEKTGFLVLQGTHAELRQEEAIKLGVELSCLLADAMFHSTDKLLDLREAEFQFKRFLQDVNGGNGIVLHNLKEALNYVKMRLKVELIRTEIDIAAPSRIQNFLKLFSDAITLLEKVIDGIRNLSPTRILKEDPEKLSALDSKIQIYKRQRDKIVVAITEVKQHCFNTKDSDKSVAELLLGEEGFVGIWRSLFLSESKVKRQESMSEPRSKRSRLEKEPLKGEGGVRRCSHCAVEETPQWREGPLGAATLCNACGVRFRMGRLEPEYRPASSPSFDMSQHSNSHRKVMELQRQKDDNCY